MLIDVIDLLIDRVKGLETQALWTAVLLWLVLSLAVGAIAQGKGHSPAYALLAILLSPLIGMAVALGLPDRRAAQIAALSARLSALDGKVEEAALMPAGGAAPRIGAWVLGVLLLIVALIAGISQLGQSANTTFQAVSSAM